MSSQNRGPWRRRNALHAQLIAVTLAAGCSGMLKEMNRGLTDWGDELPPPEAVTSGPAAEAFAPLAGAEARFTAWRTDPEVNHKTEIVLPGARFVQADPLLAEWDLSMSDSGQVLGRVGYMAVVYQDQQACVWVRGRYYQTHLGGGNFSDVEIAPFNHALVYNTKLPPPVAAEVMHRFACPQ